MQKLKAMLTPLMLLKLTLLILGWLVMGGMAQAAGFDCGKAQTKVEHIICDNPELSKLDDELSVAYKAAQHDEKRVDSIKQAQKQWMKERNACVDTACVKRAYEERISSLTTAFPDSEMAAKQDTKDNSQDGQYRFQITKGKGMPVCNAYLERLNSTHYEKPPYCDRPENNAIKGFIKLNRVPLSPKDVHDLYPILHAYNGLANNEKLDWSSMALQQELSEHGQFRLTEEGMKGLQTMLDNGSAKIWHYDPPVDIDNDGTSDNVQVWHGYPLGGSGGTRCGEDGYPVTHYGELIRQPQVAFVVSAKGDRLDIGKTEKVFAHPMGGYPIKMEGKWTVGDGFRPIGRSMEIFKYQDLYYFDTFFDSWGDIENKRRKDKQIGNTLAVLLHKDGKTRQVCEYLMTDNGTQNERESK